MCPKHNISIFNRNASVIMFSIMNFVRQEVQVIRHTYTMLLNLVAYSLQSQCFAKERRKITNLGKLGKLCFFTKVTSSEGLSYLYYLRMLARVTLEFSPQHQGFGYPPAYINLSRQVSVLLQAQSLNEFLPSNSSSPKLRSWLLTRKKELQKHNHV
jgi:hypothetical protein